MYRQKVHIVIGFNFCNTAELIVICFDKIEFEINLLISWNTPIGIVNKSFAEDDCFIIGNPAIKYKKETKLA